MISARTRAIGVMALRWLLALICLLLGSYTLYIFLRLIVQAPRSEYLGLIDFLIVTAVSFASLFFIVAGTKSTLGPATFRPSHVAIDLFWTFLLTILCITQVGQVLTERVTVFVDIHKQPINPQVLIAHAVLAGIILIINLHLIRAEWRKQKTERNYRRILFPLLLVHFFGFFVGGASIEVSVILSTLREGIRPESRIVDGTDTVLYMSNVIGGITLSLVVLLSLRAIKDDMQGVGPVIQRPRAGETPAPQ